MKEEEKHTELFELTIRKLTGQTTSDDEERLNLILMESQENKTIYENLVKTWNIADKSKGITEDEVQAEWNRLDHNLKDQHNTGSGFSMIRIAAVVSMLIAAAVVLYFVAFNTNPTEIVAEGIIEQALEDGSVVTLNSNAVLKYDDDYNKKNREVWLKGEAYFEVEKDEERPFIIHTDEIDIRVVGTSFNVLSSSERNTAEVMVTSGIVEVSAGGTRLRLRKGDVGVLNKSSKKLSKKVNENANYLAWKTRNLIFSDTPMREVIVQINKVYRKKLYIDNESLNKCPVTVSFRYQTFESVMEILTNTLDLQLQNSSEGIAVTGEGCE